MDPDEALRKIRELINDGDSADIELVHLFDGLDQWLSKGGFLPKDWSR